MNPPVAFVTGATGVIGPALVNHLLASNYTVHTYSLDAPPDGLYAAPVRSTRGDINDARALGSAMAGADVVFHLAALLHVEHPGPELVSRYEQVNVQGARTVAEQAARAGVRRLIYFSTVKVYGAQQRHPVAETFPPHPRTLYAQTKLEGEHAVRAVAGLETTVLRLATVYGPRLRGTWSRLVRAIAEGHFRPVGGLRNRHSLTYVDDVVLAVLLAAGHPDAAGGIYNVVGHETPTLREILRAIYDALDRPLPPVPVPTPLAWAGAFALQKGLAFVGRSSPITPQMVRQLVTSETYSGSALRSLGFTNQETLETGWRKTVAAMRER